MKQNLVILSIVTRNRDVFGSGEYKINPIHGEDLAKVCVQAVSSEEREICVGIPDIMTHNEIVALAFKTLNKRSKISRIPLWIRNIIMTIARMLTSVKIYGPLEFFMIVLAVVCVVVYGNRVYDNALLELKDILVERGCIPIAGVAYIGEHSFSSSEIPTAEGRPDARDLNHAELFGRKINEKLLSVSSVDQISEVDVPGSYPYEGITKLWDVDFITVSDECSQCGICAEECPVGAIDLENSYLIVKEKCVTCCAYIKNCPQNART
ncbi:4Fe-4S binding protein [candidate division CSSED10-310 bacterium]|uniref:4Fe-4S binding protein n=1 Tax=candidate division CSSED10-310 bacterium TaxID=2855610 RepID=A0ABV6Z1T0_UNCC1